MLRVQTLVDACCRPMDLELRDLKETIRMLEEENARLRAEVNRLSLERAERAGD